ncbi:hypothetical protein BDB00DRAFT_869011 [Zychaea mexicana]|uniref:uncharacterized protein n=1 Tax=Zychaea mexicana TaxID=64656 RepID=UPI0022FED6A3|nr:uncharacterized protein BDB00DRAFT_869011 [Zychaea mexicana]KAI9496785.1 hypothetical protein BDB00DRAFT_869011 [Zychaea mexicana]
MSAQTMDNLMVALYKGTCGVKIPGGCVCDDLADNMVVLVASFFVLLVVSIQWVVAFCQEKA